MTTFKEQKAIETLINDYRDFGDNPLGEHFWVVARKYLLLKAEQQNVQAELKRRGF